MPRVGLVSLVGAGPGDPDLLTVKALKAIAAADVVIFDRLVPATVQELAPPGAHRIDVGKQPGRHPVPQEAINGLLIRHAKAGRRVVRLKGGDPFLFGRGGEEVMALRAAGVPFEIVPGITAAQGCAASIGVPLTHRGLASGVRLVAGHARAGATLDLDWTGLADARTTLVVYMGLANAAEIAMRLLSAGRHPATPVLAVSRATFADARTMRCSLASLAEAAAMACLKSPTVFIIGEVVNLAALQSEPDHVSSPCEHPTMLVAAE